MEIIKTSRALQTETVFLKAQRDIQLKYFHVSNKVTETQKLSDIARDKFLKSWDSKILKIENQTRRLDQ